MNYTVETFNKNLGKRIALYREIAGLTQTELADKVGYKDRTSITKIENGTVKIPMKKLQAIAKELNTTIQTLCLIDENIIEEEETELLTKTDMFKESVSLLIKLNEDDLEKAYKLLTTMFGE